MFTFLSFILLDLLEQTRSIWLVRSPLLALDCSPGHFRIQEWLHDAVCPQMHQALHSLCTCDRTSFVFMLCLRVSGWWSRGKLLCVCMLKSIIARHKRPLISALRQPLARPSSFLKGPAVFSLTYNSQVNVSLHSYPSSLGIITDIILTCVFNRLILPFIGGSNVQRQ